MMRSGRGKEADTILKYIVIFLFVVAISVIFYGERYFAQKIQSNKKIFAENMVTSPQNEEYQELSTVIEEVYSSN
ncbi:hypothetical protein [Anaerosolibacter sp.]|uniref:hypothetical protein n=1 Tax=Anaerosolibacter sp. TaxID=1872527 RepID=UPI0039F12E6E